MHLSRNTSDASESLRGSISFGNTMPFFRLPRMPDGEGHCSSVTAIGLRGLNIVSRRSGGGRLSCCKARRSVANTPRFFSAEEPMSSPESARRAGKPLDSRTSLSLAVRNELRWLRTVVQELEGRAGDVSLHGRRLSIERAVSTRAAARYWPLVIVVWATSHSSWLELEVPLRENVLVFDTKLLSLYWAVEMLEHVLLSVDSVDACVRTLLSSSEECLTRVPVLLNAWAKWGLRDFLSSSSSSIITIFFTALVISPFNTQDTIQYTIIFSKWI